MISPNECTTPGHYLQPLQECLNASNHVGLQHWPHPSGTPVVTDHGPISKLIYFCAFNHDFIQIWPEMYISKERLNGGNLSTVVLMMHRLYLSFKKKKKTHTAVPADWYTGPLMQLQLLIQMLSGAADDRRRDAFLGKPDHISFLFAIFNTHVGVNRGGFSCYS